MALEKLYDSITKSFVETKMTDGSDVASEALNDAYRSSLAEAQSDKASDEEIESLLDSVNNTARSIKNLNLSCPVETAALHGILTELVSAKFISVTLIHRLEKLLTKIRQKVLVSSMPEETKYFETPAPFLKPREGRFEKLAREAGQLTDEKNAAYGDSFLKAGEFLALVYPDGIPVDKYTDALCLVRIFDKLMRIGTKKDAFGESPYKDIMGYALLGFDNDERNKVLQAPKSDAREVKFAEVPRTMPLVKKSTVLLEKEPKPLSVEQRLQSFEDGVKAMKEIDMRLRKMERPIVCTCDGDGDRCSSCPDLVKKQHVTREERPCGCVGDKASCSKCF